MFRSSQAFPYVIITSPDPDLLFVSADDARLYLKQEEDELPDDELIPMIKAVQAAIERFTKLTLFITEFETTRDVFTREFLLKRAPLRTVNEVSRLKKDVQVPIEATDYKTINNLVINYGRIVLKAGKFWPNDQDIERRTIRIKFNAGFGDSVDDIPEDLIYGGLRLLADLWANRGDCSCSCTGALLSMTTEARLLLGRYRILEL